MKSCVKENPSIILRSSQLDEISPFVHPKRTCNIWVSWIFSTFWVFSKNKMKSAATGCAANHKARHTFLIRLPNFWQRRKRFEKRVFEDVNVALAANNHLFRTAELSRRSSFSLQANSHQVLRTAHGTADIKYRRACQTTSCTKICERPRVSGSKMHQVHQAAHSKRNTIIFSNAR